MNWFKTKRSSNSPNFMQLGTHGMPAGAGRKGGKVAKKKQTAKRLAPSDENRVALDTTPRFQSPMQSTLNAAASPVSSFTGDYTMCPPSCSSSQLDNYGPSTSGGFQSPSVFQQPQYPGYTPWLWSPPPWVSSNPLPRVSQSPGMAPVPIDNPYKVCFKSGNISVCNGCRHKLTILSFNMQNFVTIPIHNLVYLLLNSETPIIILRESASN